MGYSYYFAICVVSWPKDIDLSGDVDLESYLQTIAKAIKKLEEKDEEGWFPRFGVKDSTGSRGYGTGPTDELEVELIKIGKLFPEYTFDVYHFYDDCFELTVHTVKGDEIIDTNEIDLKRKGRFPMSMGASPETTFLKNDMTIYINPEYGWEFDYEPIKLPIKKS